MRKNTVLEVHRYAPELNKVIFYNGKKVSIPIPGIDTIKVMREKLFKPCKCGKFAKITFDTPFGHEVRQGYCGNGYKSVKVVLSYLKKRYNLTNAFNVSIFYMG